MNSYWFKISFYCLVFLATMCSYPTFIYSQNNTIKKDYRDDFLPPYYIRLSGYDSTRLKDVTNKFLSIDFSGYLNKENKFINGIFSENYARVRVHYDTIYKINPSTYQVKGKLKIRDTISVMDGQMKIQSIFLDPFLQGDKEVPNPTYCISIISTCNFSLKPTAQLNGIVQTILNLDTLTDEFSYYYGNNSDYYMNNTFVGIWKSQKQIEKCIWGIGLLPFEFTGDFRINETYVTEKHLQNGWKEYGKLNELGLYIENNDKWWE